MYLSSFAWIRVLLFTQLAYEEGVEASNEY